MPAFGVYSLLMKWLTALLLCVAAILAGLLTYRSFTPQPLAGGTALDNPVTVPALQLVNDQGVATTLAASDGRLRLMFFGYVHCPDVCPATLASLKNTYEALRPEQQKQVQVQFVSVDPVVDTPPLVREYLNKFNTHFTGLTGKPDTIDQAAQALFVANVEPMPADHSHHSGHTNHTASADAVSASTAARIHGDEVRIINPAGQLVRVYTNAEALSGTLKADLPALIKQYSR